MGNLNKGPKKFFEFLRTKRSGDILSEDDILQAANWTSNSLYTYRKKNKISPFLAELPDGHYKVVNDGDKLSERHFQSVFTQVKPRIVAPKKGDPLASKTDVYVLDSFVGAGAVGQVWRAARGSNGDLVAVKIMLPRADLLAPSVLDNVTERFRREARNGLQLSSPHVIRHLDVGEWEKTPFVIMDLADASLGSELGAAGSLSEEAAGRVVSAMVDGLSYLHSRNCIHRDVKPDNMLRLGSRYVLGDLGVVKWSDLDPAFTGAATITRASIQLGSWYYMSPEQLARPHEAVPASDIYGLGVSWFEMLRGDTPDPIAVGAKKFPAPSTDPEVSKLIGLMLSYEAAERPTASALRRDLDTLGFRT